MPTIEQPSKPPEITVKAWSSSNRKFILEFLAPNGGSYLFYQVMKNDPDEIQSKQEKVNAQKVDKILDLQKRQFLAQADNLRIDPTTQSPVKVTKKQSANKSTDDADDTEGMMPLDEALAELNATLEPISFVKIPPGVYGEKDLQLALYKLLCTMGSANYSTVTCGILPTTPTCGTDLLRVLNNIITPASTDTNKKAKKQYIDHKDSFTDTTNFVPWWTTLLLLQMTKANLGIAESTPRHAMDDACEIIEEKTGVQSRWSMEIMAWRMKSAAEEAAKTGCQTDEEKVTSFEHHMRLHQLRRDTSAKPPERGALATDFCDYCFKKVGKRFNNHTEAQCHRKKRDEAEVEAARHQPARSASSAEKATS